MLGRPIRLAVAVMLALGLLPMSGAVAAPADLFFSEYVEGSGNSKALEIYNGTAEDVDLAAAGYVVQVFFNGNLVAGSTIPLAGVVASRDVWVLADDESASALLALADQTTTEFLFNGDDAAVLRKGGEGGQIVDVIGQIGFDPGDEWGSGLISTQNNTLRRRPSVIRGDTNAFDDFAANLDAVSGEWDGFPQDTFAGLGQHVTN